jgi:hypothetical protein
VRRDRPRTFVSRHAQAQPAVRGRRRTVPCAAAPLLRAVHWRGRLRRRVPSNQSGAHAYLACVHLVEFLHGYTVDRIGGLSLVCGRMIICNSIALTVTVYTV